MESKLVCVIQKGNGNFKFKRVNLVSIAIEEYAGLLLGILTPASSGPYTETWGLDTYSGHFQDCKSSFL